MFQQILKFIHMPQNSVYQINVKRVFTTGRIKQIVITSIYGQNKICLVQ